MPFGDKWRKLGAGYWNAMADRCADLPFNDILAAKVLAVGSVIEIGCGAGHLAESLFARGYRGSYWACDFSPAAVDAARARLGSRATVEAGQFEVLSGGGRVPAAELVIARSVIQHQAHWLPMVRCALRHAPTVALGISRSIYFKETGEHEARDRGGFYDVRISLEAMKREAAAVGVSCEFERTEGQRGPEVVITLRGG